jgi:CxxC-x17-CxxC domain-containing protein
MSYQDKSFQRFEFPATFSYGAEEQEQFASRDDITEPNHTPSYREARKLKQTANDGSHFNVKSSMPNSSGYSSAPRQMFPSKCATCGKDTQVPFEPRGDRPVYCPNCYRRTNPVKRY